MLKLYAEVSIQSSVKAVWEYMNNIEGWWALSNSDHVSLKFFSQEHYLHQGMRAVLAEQFGGIRGESQGVIVNIIPEQEVVWQSEKAVYSYLLFKIHLDQTVVWNLQEHEKGVGLSMTVSLEFFPTLWGKISEWYFAYVLQGKRLIVNHSLNELRYIKKVMEGIDKNNGTA